MTATIDGTKPVVVDGAETEPKPVDTAQFIQDSADSAGRKTFLTGCFLGTGLSTITNWIVECASCGEFGGWHLVPMIGGGALLGSALTTLATASHDQKIVEDVVEIAVQQSSLSSARREAQVVSPHDLLMRTEHEVFGAKVMQFACGFSLGWCLGSVASFGVMVDNDEKFIPQAVPYFAQGIISFCTGTGMLLGDLKRSSSLKKVFAFSRKSDNTCG